MSNTTDALKALLGATKEVKSEVYITRLGAHFTVRALDSAEFESARDQATFYSGSGARREKKIDQQIFNCAVVAKGCVDPAFNDTELMAKYDASAASDCVYKALLPGEIQKVLDEILTLSGFGDEDEAIEEAKN